MKTDRKKDFEDGRALAVAMLREAERIGDNGYSSVERYARDGKPQVRYVREYLVQLIDKPWLLEGFSAALTGALNSEECRATVDHIEELPAAEFEAGVPGEDGTDVGCWEPAAARPPTPAIATTPRKKRREVPA